MHFGPWHPLCDAEREAPPAPGVLQLRAEAIFAYQKGLSAMVYYACSAPSQTLRQFVEQCGKEVLPRVERQGACWIRFGEADEPERELNRLLQRFERQFGSRPIGNTTSIDGDGGAANGTEQR